MTTDSIRVIVEDGLCSNCAVHVKRVHHRDFPELQAECGSVTEAVAHLVGMLSADREGARSGWQREAIDLAIGDVNALLAGLTEAGSDAGPACRCAPRASGRPEPSIAGDRPAP